MVGGSNPPGTMLNLKLSITYFDFWEIALKKEIAIALLWPKYNDGVSSVHNSEMLRADSKYVSLPDLDDIRPEGFPDETTEHSTTNPLFLPANTTTTLRLTDAMEVRNVNCGFPGLLTVTCE